MSYALRLLSLKSVRFPSQITRTSASSSSNFKNRAGKLTRASVFASTPSERCENASSSAVLSFSISSMVYRGPSNINAWTGVGLATRCHLLRVRQIHRARDAHDVFQRMTLIASQPDGKVFVELFETRNCILCDRYWLVQQEIHMKPPATVNQQGRLYRKSVKSLLRFSFSSFKVMEIDIDPCSGEIFDVVFLLFREFFLGATPT